MNKTQTILLLGKKYELTPHPDGTPGFRCWETRTWAWPGILR